MTRTIPKDGKEFRGYNDVNEIISIVGGWLPRFEDAAKDDD